VRIDIFDVDGMIAHHHIRQCVPGFRKAVATMADMADGDITAFDEGTVGFMAGRPDHFHQKAIDRLLRLWFRHYRREVVRRGDENRYLTQAARRALAGLA
jgi:hypothetical protein